MKIVPSQIMKIYESSLVGRQGLYERGYKVRAAGQISIIQRLIKIFAWKYSHLL